MGVAAKVTGHPSGLGFLPDGTLLVVSMQKRCAYKVIDGGLHLRAELSNSIRADFDNMEADG